MRQAVGSDTSVGVCASGLLTDRDTLGTGGGAASSNEWYWLRMARMGADAVKRMLTGTVLEELRKLR